MPIMNKPQFDRKLATSAAATLSLALIASPAHAYMGAGAGLSALGSMLSFVGVFLLMVLGFVWFPLKRAIKKMTGKSEQAQDAASEKPAETEAES